MLTTHLLLESLYEFQQVSFISNSGAAHHLYRLRLHTTTQPKQSTHGMLIDGARATQTQRATSF
jgi:hypothetical protein